MVLQSPEKAVTFYLARREKLIGKMCAEELPALLITDLANVRYLSGFTGSSGHLLVTPETIWFMTDSRYTTQAEKQICDVKIVEYKEEVKSIVEVLEDNNIKEVGFESEHISSAIYDELLSKLGTIKLKPTKKLVETIRITKDELEMTAIRKLIFMLEQVFPHARDLVQPGTEERQVAIELEYRLRKLGADGPAFDFIVASGERSAVVHGVASDKVIQKDEIVILDWGAKAWGYHSDNTRTLSTGEVGEELRDIYKIVWEANRAAIESVKPGIELKAIDDAARNIIKKSGYGEFFVHGTGHGVGLNIHEQPTVSWKGNAAAKPDMVFTIEPGVYVRGTGGVRLEDMVLVTETGCEVLTGRIAKPSVLI